MKAKKISIDKLRKWGKRKARVTNRIARSDRAWLTVYRSSKHIYAQLVDPTSGRTIATASSRSREIVGEGPTGNVEAAKKVGTAIAGLAKQRQIDRVVFNRNGFLYHGRVKALADAAREAGLEF